MRKITITNKFHRTETVILSDAATAYEAWDELICDAYGRNDSRAKARHRRAMKVLCGVDGCKCGGFWPAQN